MGDTSSNGGFPIAMLVYRSVIHVILWGTMSLWNLWTWTISDSFLEILVGSTTNEALSTFCQPDVLTIMNPHVFPWIPSLKLSYPLRIVGWKTILSFWENPLYFQVSRVFLVVTALYTGGQPARKLTRGPFFLEGCLRALSREACFREMFSRTLLFSTSWNESCHIFMATSSSSLAPLPSPSWAHLPLQWAHLPLHGHIFHFIGTSSSSLAHLPLHRHIFPFIGTSSPSSAHLPLHGYIFVSRTGGGGALAGHGLLPRELSRGFRRDTRGTLSQKCPIRFTPHLHALNLRGETSKTDPRFAYADCLREDYGEASARCLRVPTRTCKYQCFRFRGVNMSSPHKKVPSFQKKNVAQVSFG